MSTNYKVSMTLGYKDTDFTRTYEFPADIEALATVKSKILTYNSNVPATDKLVFISDDYDDSDPEDIIGTLEGIKSAKIIAEEVTKIPLF